MKDSELLEIVREAFQRAMKEDIYEALNYLDDKIFDAKFEETEADARR